MSYYCVPVHANCEALLPMNIRGKHLVCFQESWSAFSYLDSPFTVMPIHHSQISEFYVLNFNALRDGQRLKHAFCAFTFCCSSWLIGPVVGKLAFCCLLLFWNVFSTAIMLCSGWLRRVWARGHHLEEETWSGARVCLFSALYAETSTWPIREVPYTDEAAVRCGLALE